MRTPEAAAEGFGFWPVGGRTQRQRAAAHGWPARCKEREKRRGWSEMIMAGGGWLKKLGSLFPERRRI